MNVTEDLLQVTAKDIVQDYVNNGETLTDGVKKKASEMGLNKDQTARLIERTNSEAFLSVFPEKSEFNVADPNAILSEKVASERKALKSYAEQVSRDFDDIFGNTVEKQASTDINIYSEDLARAKVRDMVFEGAMLEQTRLAKFAAESLIDQAEKVAWHSFRDTVLFGTPVESLETQLVLAYPEKRAFVESVVEEFTDRLGKTGVDRRLLKRASNIDIEDIIGDTPIAESFKGLMELV